MFKDRADAAHQLAIKLAPYRDRHPLVLAIPRGAVPMGKTIAQQLGGDFDVVLVHKLCAPFQPEVAIGAVAENGWTYVDPSAQAMGIDPDYLDAQKNTQLAALRARRAQYAPGLRPMEPRGRVLIVVDDGLATGATMISALHSLRQRQPAQLICAIPVASPEALKKIRPMADEVVCLHAPAEFQAVGQYYAHFPQVQDQDVVALLLA